jgi:4-alpha-glucanotransferase
LEEKMEKIKEMWRKLVDVSMMSVAKTCIIPLQDWLGLPNSARMNTPGTMGPENWSWRVRRESITDEVAYKLRELNAIYGRL